MKAADVSRPAHGGQQKMDVDNEDMIRRINLVEFSREKLW
jgi:hypothetical protein